MKRKIADNMLVPISEQPYEIPQNWRWVKLENIANWGSGGTPSRKIKEYYLGNIPWIKTGELNNCFIYDTEEKITSEAIKNSNAKLYPVNTIAVAMYGATIGKVGILGVEATTNQACACAVCKDSISYMFLFYYLLSQKSEFIKKSKGGAQPNISQEVIKNHLFPLPPLPEQQRIVNRIESLFSKLDEAKEKAQSVLDGFELRKAAILHKAFTGELTRRWRKENRDERKEGQLEAYEAVNEQNETLPTGWNYVKLSEVVIGFKYGTSEKSSYENKGLPVLRIPNIGNDGQINLEDLKYLSSETIGEANLVKENDILIIRSNGSRDLVGKCALVSNLTKEYAYASFLIRIRPSKQIFPSFLLKYLSSLDAQRQMFNSAKSSAGINNINSQELGTINIFLPPLAEQQEIVRILNNALEKEKQAKIAAESVIEKIDLMKKSILAKAFRGKLGTNNPTEPAENLT